VRGEVAAWLQRHRLPGVPALHERACGGVLVEELRPLPISSTEIRAMLQGGRSPRYLLPETVLDYIETHHLYQ
jgi:nicotinate-nucleotide adenylyltransferase